MPDEKRTPDGRIKTTPFRLEAEILRQLDAIVAGRTWIGERRSRAGVVRQLIATEYASLQKKSEKSEKKSR